MSTLNINNFPVIHTAYLETIKGQFINFPKYNSMDETDVGCINRPFDLT